MGIRSCRFGLLLVAVVFALLRPTDRVAGAHDGTPSALASLLGTGTVVVTIVDVAGDPIPGQCVDAYSYEGEDFPLIDTFCDGGADDPDPGVVSFALEVGFSYSLDLNVDTMPPMTYVDFGLSTGFELDILVADSVSSVTLVVAVADSAHVAFSVGTPGGPPNVEPPLLSLAGACFLLRTASGTPTEPACSDESGGLTFLGLTADTYTLEPTSLPAGCRPFSLPSFVVTEADYGPPPTAGYDTNYLGEVVVLCEDPGTVTLTVHAATCPEDFGDPFVECHDNARAGILFVPGRGALGEAIVTDEQGVATGDIVIVGDQLEVFEGYDSFDFTFGAYVVCSEQQSGEVRFDARVRENRVLFPAENGEELVCDWYTLTVATGEAPDDDAGENSGQDGDDTDTDTSEDVTTFPNTGAGRSTTTVPMGWMLVGALAALVALLGIGVAVRRSKRWSWA